MHDGATRMINVALNKPTIQSSLSDWSAGYTFEPDSSIATNGDTAIDAVVHTDREHAPWCQVDLQNDSQSRRFVILQPQDNSDRLKHFTAPDLADRRAGQLA